MKDWIKCFKRPLTGLKNKLTFLLARAQPISKKECRNESRFKKTPGYE
jgi:hypothetical protein